MHDSLFTFMASRLPITVQKHCGNWQKYGTTLETKFLWSWPGYQVSRVWNLECLEPQPGAPLTNSPFSIQPFTVLSRLFMFWTWHFFTSEPFLFIYWVISHTCFVFFDEREWNKISLTLHLMPTMALKNICTNLGCKSLKCCFFLLKLCPTLLIRRFVQRENYS